jgi:hypothetical protein
MKLYKTCDEVSNRRMESLDRNRTFDNTFILFSFPDENISDSKMHADRRFDSSRDERFASSSLND